MIRRTFLAGLGAALVLAAVPAAVMSADASADPAPADPAVASQRWLALIDRADYGASWTEASPEFQKRIPQDKWVAAVRGARGPLGAVKTRSVSNVTKTKTMPGLPDGDYAVVEFQTAFANKAGAVETVTLIGEAGVPKVGGYFIK